MFHPIVLPYFGRQLHRLSKKYRKLQDAVSIELQQFDTRIHAKLGRDLYKVRLRSSDLQRGKSNSFRMIVLVMETRGFLVPVAIYAKSDIPTLSKAEVTGHLVHIHAELQEYIHRMNTDLF